MTLSFVSIMKARCTTNPKWMVFLCSRPHHHNLPKDGRKKKKVHDLAKDEWVHSTSQHSGYGRSWPWTPAQYRTVLTWNDDENFIPETKDYISNQGLRREDGGHGEGLPKFHVSGPGTQDMWHLPLRPLWWLLSQPICLPKSRDSPEKML